MVRISVDSSSCNGHGLCQLISPSVFEVDPETGFNEAGEFEVPDSLAAAARSGVDACPERAIRILER